jgi:hypothetical protein
VYNTNYWTILRLHRDQLLLNTFTGFGLFVCLFFWEACRRQKYATKWKDVCHKAESFILMMSILSAMIMLITFLDAVWYFCNYFYFRSSRVSSSPLLKPGDLCLGFHRGENGFGLTGVLFRASVYEMFISTVFVPDFFSFETPA